MGARQDLLALAERIERTPAYSPAELGSKKVRQTDKSPGTGSKRTKCILVNQKWRKDIAAALRAYGRVGWGPIEQSLYEAVK